MNTFKGIIRLIAKIPNIMYTTSKIKLSTLLQMGGLVSYLIVWVQFVINMMFTFVIGPCVRK